MLKVKKIYKILFLLNVAFFWMAMSTSAPVLIPVAQKLKVSESMLGLINGSMGIVMILFSIPYTILSDRAKKKKIFIITGSVLVVLQSLVFIIAPSASRLLISKILGGFAVLSYPVMMALFTGYFKDENALKAVSTVMIFESLGILTGNLLGGVLGDFEYLIPFYAAAAFGVLSLILNTIIKEDREAKLKQSLTIKDCISVISEKNIIKYSLMGLIATYFLFAATFTFIPFIANTKFSASVFQISLISVISLLMSMLASSVISKFSDKMNTSRWLLGSIIVFTPLYMMMPYYSSLILLFVMMTIASFALGISTVLVRGLAIKEISSEKRGSALGVYNSISSIGMFLGSFVTGIIVNNISLEAGFLSLGILGGISLLLLRIKNRSKEDVIAVGEV